MTPQSEAAGKKCVFAAYDAGYRLFDNADIYCRGIAERIFGQALKEVPRMREEVLIATKCGIRPAGTPNADSPARYDFSAEHIVRSCEESLKRLQVETIDIYQLHRPDYLAEPEEIASAFSQLKQSGKVRYFGVSNFRPMLLTAIQVACPMPIIVHQVEISLAKLEAFTDGTLDQCLIEKISPMAWSPLAAGLLGQGATRLLPSQQLYTVERINAALDEIAKLRGVSRVVVALAWLLKHPAKIIPIVGSTNPQKILAAVHATEIELTREEWYRLLTVARGEPLP